MGDKLEIKYDVTDFSKNLGDFIKKLENREALMREMAAAMGDAVEENFRSEGRPAWAGWSPRYAKTRQGGKILQKSGRLATSINQHSDNDSATVGTNVKYARIHQEGGTINQRARKQTVHFRQDKHGNVGKQFVKKSRSNFAQTVAVAAYKIKMPARPFLHLTEQDVEGMEETGSNYFKRLIDD